MPRWPDKENKLELVKPEEAEQEDKPALLPLPESVLHDKLDYLIQLVQDANSKAPALDSGQGIAKLQRRRTEDEMRYALRVFANGLPRQRDDEHEQVLEDAIGELLSLRQITMDLMQSMATAQQNGLAAIRKMTER